MSSFEFAANLFKVGLDRNFSFPGAPTLVPDNGNSYDVNVYSEYPWTVSDDARNYIPKILLTEYKLTRASELNALLRKTAGATQNTEIAPIAAALLTVGASDLFLTRQLAGGASSLKQDKVNGKIISMGQETVEDDDILTGIGDSKDTSLAPYRGLYTTEKTGWGYILPYLGAGNMTDINNTFAEADFTNRFTPGLKAGLDFVGVKQKSVLEDAKGVLNLPIANVAGALLAEAPISFTKTSKESIKVEFYLLNTVNPEDIRKNYEFCYLFTYQNLPNRRAINILDSPPLYRATIIGYKTLPVCYIDGLKIENVGAVRLIDIGPTTDKNKADNSVLRNPTNSNNNTVKMIPEAYKISFTLQSAFMNSQNMFVFAANPQGVVTTSIKLPAKGVVRGDEANGDFNPRNSALQPGSSGVI